MDAKASTIIQGQNNSLMREKLEGKYLNLDWKKPRRDTGNYYKVMKVMNKMDTELLLIEFYSILNISKEKLRGN